MFTSDYISTLNVMTANCVIAIEREPRVEEEKGRAIGKQHSAGTGQKSRFVVNTNPLVAFIIILRQTSKLLDALKKSMRH